MDVTPCVRFDHRAAPYHQQATRECVPKDGADDINLYHATMDIGNL
jgi:hypothetical protein